MAKSAVSLAVKSITTKDSHATSEQSYIKETIDGFFDDLYPKCLFRAQADYLDSYYKTIFAIQKSENRLSTPRKPQNNVEEMINSSLISKRESIYTDIQNHIMMIG
ncbi:MAG: hypothetical protein PHV07_09625 [Oscillospiraceae bacterium]|nr:hypothetical protein [Oscillospiraceae bacterium]